jgi:hypothetical protein
LRESSSPRPPGATECWRLLIPRCTTFPRQMLISLFYSPQMGQSYCEFKGQASYYDVVADQQEAKQAAWYYPNPSPAFSPIAGFVAFYPSRMDRCLVDGEIVTPQEGNFYGGWITHDVVGPFKGEPGHHVLVRALKKTREQIYGTRKTSTWPSGSGTSSKLVSRH